MTGLAIYRTAVAPEWIDYNGHLRDAYYSLIVSLAADALMDRIGMDEAYRVRTRCTLYTLEMHVHFLREVKKSDVVDVAVRILGTDRKRIHAAFDMRCERYPEPVATAELMLLHVFQGDTPGAQVFPAEVVEALARVTAEASGGGASGGAAARAASADGRVAGGHGPGATAPGSTGGAAARVTTVGAASSAPVAIPGSRRMELRSRS